MTSDQLNNEIAEGHGLYLAQAAQRFPPHRKGRPVTLGCVLRWVVNGVKLPTGEVVRLEASRLAGRWITSAGAIARFLQRQTPRAGDRPPPRSPARRQKAADRAAKELERMGI